MLAKTNERELSGEIKRGFRTEIERNNDSFTTATSEASIRTGASSYITCNISQ